MWRKRRLNCSALRLGLDLSTTLGRFWVRYHFRQVVFAMLETVGSASMAKVRNRNDKQSHCIPLSILGDEVTFSG